MTTWKEYVVVIVTFFIKFPLGQKTYEIVHVCSRTVTAEKWLSGVFMGEQ